MAKKKEATPHLRLRVEPELLAQLEKSRQRGGRTITGEIVRRLELSFTREKIRASAADTAATMIELVADTLSPNLPPDIAEQHLRKVIESLKRIASRLREDSNLREDQS
jgi:hypothetical protein